MRLVLAAAATLLAVSAASAQTIYVEPAPPVYVQPAPRYYVPPPAFGPEAVVTERTYVVRRRPAIVVAPRPYVAREFVPRVVVDPYW
jgi:hypothetical protein